MNERFLLPGEFATTSKPMHFGTLLGSCVSVCLRNAHRQLAAMNHFMLPTAQGHAEIGRFGDTSTERIIATLMALDPDPRRLRARVFGGGAVLGHLGNFGQVGRSNIEVARQILNKHGITTVSEQVGGTRGKRIDFYTETDVVTCRDLGVTPSAGAKNKETRVLIVDDSSVVRRVLRTGIDGAQGLRVVGEAENPFQARELILASNPDVITLDIEMPRMDGLTFLRHLMAHFPKPVVIVSSSAKRGSETERKAKEAGARGVLDKDQLQIFRGSKRVREVVAPVLLRAAGRWPTTCATAPGGLG